MISWKKANPANKIAYPANQRKNQLKTLANRKGGRYLYNVVMPHTSEYYRVYIERLFALLRGWIGALFMP